MWELITLFGLIAVVGAVAWTLLRWIRQAQAADRSCSDKDSGWHNDAG
jgi:hypothetical protein